MNRGIAGRLALDSQRGCRREWGLGWAGKVRRTRGGGGAPPDKEGPSWWRGVLMDLVRALPDACLCLACGHAVAEGGERSIRHRLVEGSTLLDDCPPCARPAVPVRLRGTFDLAGVASEPGIQRMELRNIAWHAPTVDGARLMISGTGQLTIWAGRGQHLVLDLLLTMGGTNLSRRFTNTTAAVSRPLPHLAVDLESQEKTPSQLFELSLRSAPMRELWFVTSHGFTPGQDGGAGWERRVAGDILSVDGHVVARNAVLTGKLGIMPLVPPLAVGALDVRPGARVLFTLRRPVFSETLGQLSPGTVLGSDGSVFARVRGLLAPFGPMEGPAAEPGVDAIQVLDSGEVLFSTTSNVPTAGGTLAHGDVLSSRGGVRWRQKEILAAFAPSPLPGTALEEVGIDAWHEWPHGEAWFSVRNGFQSAVAGTVRPGDLLSTRGWVIYRNLDLMEGFQPLEDLADFGLEGLFVLTDLAPAPDCGSARCIRLGDGMVVEGVGWARAWQLEWAPSLGVPFEAVGNPTPWARWTRMTGGEAGFFRVRSW